MPEHCGCGDPLKEGEAVCRACRGTDAYYDGILTQAIKDYAANIEEQVKNLFPVVPVALKGSAYYQWDGTFAKRKPWWLRMRQRLSNKVSRWRQKVGFAIAGCNPYDDGDGYDW